MGRGVREKHERTHAVTHASMRMHVITHARTHQARGGLRVGDALGAEPRAVDVGHHHARAAGLVVGCCQRLFFFVVEKQRRQRVEKSICCVQKPISMRCQSQAANLQATTTRNPPPHSLTPLTARPRSRPPLASHHLPSPRLPSPRLPRAPATSCLPVLHARPVLTPRVPTRSW